jgi:hypothetical protein
LQGLVQGLRIASHLARHPVGVVGIQEEVSKLVYAPSGNFHGNLGAPHDASSVISSHVNSGVLAQRTAVHDVLNGRGVGLPEHLVLVGRHGANGSTVASLGVRVFRKVLRKMGGCDGSASGSWLLMVVRDKTWGTMAGFYRQVI